MYKKNPYTKKGIKKWSQLRKYVHGIHYKDEAVPYFGFYE
jgi:hypothetical protein